MVLIVIKFFLGWGGGVGRGDLNPKLAWRAGGSVQGFVFLVRTVTILILTEQLLVLLLPLLLVLFIKLIR
jgi:hypothetical protein